VMENRTRMEKIRLESMAREGIELASNSIRYDILRKARAHSFNLIPFAYRIRVNRTRPRLNDRSEHDVDTYIKITLDTQTTLEFASMPRA